MGDPKKIKPVRAWALFDTVHKELFEERDGLDPFLIYRHRQAAEENAGMWAGVVEVEIRPVTKKRKPRRSRK